VSDRLRSRLNMDPWVLWLIAGVIFAVGEMATTGFFLAPFAGGAVIAALLAAAGAGATIEWAVFLVVSVVLLAALRPVARQHQRTRGQIKTGTAALVGQTATVVERIANAEGVGCVRLDGEIWTARAFMDEDVFEPGARVQVLEIRGATALVSE
jgi:membrane protein implicated in regulation of membrane protease activity